MIKMKKLSLYASLFLLLGTAFTGCKEDTQPRMDVPTEFVLNTPPTANETYVFRSNDNNIIFTVSQPNYGVATTPDYQVQIAKSVEDFETWDYLVAENNYDTDSVYLGTDSLPYVVTLDPPVTTATITIEAAVFCEGVNTLYGMDLDNYSEDPVQVAVRVHAWMPNAPQSSIFSNIIVLPKVSSYIPLSDPRDLFLIGQPQGWNIAESNMIAKETGIGTNIYKGTFDIPAGAFQFRFYSKLGDWETNSYGAQVEDNPVDIEFTDGKYEGDVVVGKGSWQNSNWGGGAIDVVINLNDMTIEFAASEGKKVYIVGQCNGWNIDSEKLFLLETESGSNIYTNTIEIAAGEFTFRIYTELGDWNANSIGAGAGYTDDDDTDYDVAFTSGNYTGPAYDGKGKWNDPTWAGGEVTITLDLNTYEISFDIPE